MCHEDIESNDVPFPHQLTQKVRGKASPRGSWPKGPERARDGIPAASGRHFSLLALSAAPVFPGENPHFPIESFIPEMYSQSSFYVLSKGSQTALCGKRTTFDENCGLITKKIRLPLCDRRIWHKNKSSHSGGLREYPRFQVSGA